MNWHFIEPLDVLYLRDNRLFGEPGSYGEALLPPWPSTAAGAIRSAILVRDGIDLDSFAHGQVAHDTLGSPASPGNFEVCAFSLARRESGLEALYLPPADLVISKTAENSVEVRRLQPLELSHHIACSMSTARLPVLARPERGKPDGGWWLTQSAYEGCLQGETPTVDGMVRTEDLWHMDERVGVGLDPARRRAGDGKLFTAQAVALRENLGFLAATAGDSLEHETLLRFGGDGRAAHCEPVPGYTSPEPDLAAIVRERRCRIVLTTPGIFAGGWRLAGMSDDGSFELGGVRGRIASAAVNRAEVISGWDLANRQPRPAQRAVPVGSVYWLEDMDADEAALRKLVKHGLWPETDYDKHRRVEGFNRFTFAAY